MNISLKLTPSARKHILDKSFDKKYGARPLRRALQNMVEDNLAEKILEGKIKANDSVTVSVKNKKLTFEKEN
jgi:ATP-dependent Clp protease ATP-binding subunit ClpC